MLIPLASAFAVRKSASADCRSAAKDTGRHAIGALIAVTLIALTMMALLAVIDARRAEAQDRTLPDIVAPSPQGVRGPAPATTAPSTAPAAPTPPAGTPPAVGVVFVDAIDAAAIRNAGQDLVRVRARIAEPIGSGEDSRRVQSVLLRGNFNYDGAAGNAGAVRWTSVMRGDTGAVTVLPTPLESRFRFAGTPEIYSGQTVTAAGDTAGLLNAVRVLYGEAPAAPVAAADPAVAGAAGLAPGAESQPLQQGIAGGQASPVAATGAGLGDRSDIKLPEKITAGKDEEPPVTGTTTEGCSPRVDLAANVVVVQSRFTENGVPVGACSDSSTTFGIRVTDSGCTDLVDTATGVARPQSRRYYVDGGGTTQFVDADCQPSADVSFPLAEDASQCTPLVDVNALTATLRSRLVYVNGKGSTITVLDCRPQPGQAPVALTNNTAGCALRHDFTGGVSYEQGELSYTLGGQKVIVQSCSDTGATFAHQRLNDVCNPVVDLNAGVATPQYRIQVMRGGAPQYITDCTPDTSAMVNLAETKEGCESTFLHNAGAGQSFGTSRFYHEITGTRTYVTSCVQDPETTFAHLNQTTGYQHNDQTKISLPLTRIHFMAPLVGDVEVSGPMVRPGAPELPYVLRTTETRPSGQTTYVGCDAYEERDTWKVYDRVDATVFEEKTGPAAPGNPRASCHPVVSWIYNGNNGTWQGGGVCGQTYSNYDYVDVYWYYRWGEYDGTNKVTREDGAIVNTLTAKRTYSYCNQGCGNDWAVPGGCAANPPPTDANTWNAGLGWQ